MMKRNEVKYSRINIFITITNLHHQAKSIRFLFSSMNKILLFLLLFVIVISTETEEVMYILFFLIFSNDELCSIDMVDKKTKELFTDLGNQLRTIENIIKQLSVYKPPDYMDTSQFRGEWKSCNTTRPSRFNVYLQKGGLSIIQENLTQSNMSTLEWDQDLFERIYYQVALQIPGYFEMIHSATPGGLGVLIVLGATNPMISIYNIINLFIFL